MVISVLKLSASSSEVLVELKNAFQMDGQTDKPSYSDPWTHLKIAFGKTFVAVAFVLLLKIGLPLLVQGVPKAVGQTLEYLKGGKNDPMTA